MNYWARVLMMVTGLVLVCAGGLVLLAVNGR